MAKCCKAFTLRSSATRKTLPASAVRSAPAAAVLRGGASRTPILGGRVRRFVSHTALCPLSCVGSCAAGRAGRIGTVGIERGATGAGASRPPHQARPCGSSVGPGRAQSGHPDLSRPTLTVAQWQWRRAGTQLAANARWAAWAIEVNTRRRPTGSAGPTMAAHFDLPYSASALDGNSTSV